MHTVLIYFLLFISYSIMGWIIEVLGKLIQEKRIINRGFLIGPYCPIYGCGGLLITLLLTKYQEDPLVLLVLSMIICSVLEYYTSWAMEKLFNARWWDYSTKPLNINGRICLDTLAIFGILGMFMIYAINPFLFKVFGMMSDKLITGLSIFILVIFILDIVLSTNILCLISSDIKKFDKDNTEEITTKIKNTIISHGALYKRVILAFPAVKYIRNVIVEELTKDKLKQQKIILETEKRIEKIRLENEYKIQKIRQKTQKRIEKLEKSKKSVHKSKKI